LAEALPARTLLTAAPALTEALPSGTALGRRATLARATLSKALAARTAGGRATGARTKALATGATRATRATLSRTALRTIRFEDVSNLVGLVLTQVELLGHIPANDRSRSTKLKGNLAIPTELLLA